jgi:hypothetical protein
VSDTANSTPPGFPQPGLNDPERAGPLPLLAFAPGASPCQAAADLSALATQPPAAGPLATVPTMQMQDFGQPIGQTVITPPDGDTASSGS